MKKLITTLLTLALYATIASAQVAPAVAALQKAFNRPVTVSIKEVSEGDIKITDRGRKDQILADANKLFADFLRTHGTPTKNLDRRAFDPEKLWGLVMSPSTSGTIIELLNRRGSLLSSLRSSIESTRKIVTMEPDAALRQKWEAALVKAEAAFKKLEENPSDSSARFELRSFIQLVKPFESAASKS